MGAIKSTDTPLSRDELLELWHKHDIFGKTELPYEVAVGLVKDVFRLYNAHLSKDAAAQFARKLDHERLGVLTWVDFGRLGGKAHRKLRRRAQKALEHPPHRRSWGIWLDHVTGQIEYPEVEPFLKSEVPPEKNRRLDCRALRFGGLETHPGIGRRLALHLRVMSGDPRWLRDDIDRSLFEDPCVESATAYFPNGYQELDPTTLSFFHKSRSYIHTIVCETTMCGQLLPMADAVERVSDIYQKGDGGVVKKYSLKHAAASEVDEPQEAELVVLWGNIWHAHFRRAIHVVRAVGLADERLSVQVTLRSAGSAARLSSYWTNTVSGPCPQFNHLGQVEWFDEGDMTLDADVYIVRCNGKHEKIAELEKPINQSEIQSADRCSILPLQPLQGVSPCAFIVLAFEDLPMVQLELGSIRAKLGGKLREEYGRARLMVRASVRTADPLDGVRSDVVTSSETERLSRERRLTRNKNPVFKEPVTLCFAPDPKLVVQLAICACPFGLCRAPDEIADMVLPVEEVLRLAEIPHAPDAAEEYDLRCFRDGKRHGTSKLRVSFSTPASMRRRLLEDNGTIKKAAPPSALMPPADALKVLGLSSVTSEQQQGYAPTLITRNDVNHPYPVKQPTEGA